MNEGNKQKKNKQKLSMKNLFLKKHFILGTLEVNNQTGALKVPPPNKMHSSMAVSAVAYGKQSKAETPEPIAKFASMFICAVRCAGLTCPSAAVQRPSAATARHRRPGDAAARLPSRHMEESWMAALNSLECDRGQQPPARRPPGPTWSSHSRPPSALISQP